MQNDKKCTVFLKKRDNYALPINLTYNGLKKYPTAAGGILSIVSSIVVIGWLALNVMSILNFENTVSQSLDIVNVAGQPTTIWDMSED